MLFNVKIFDNFLLLGYKLSLVTSEKSMLESNENFLLESARAGDQAAFRIIYTRYRLRMKNLVGQHVNNQQDIDDIVQIIFIRAFKGMRKFRGESTLFTWMFSIAMSSLKNYYGKKMRIDSILIYSVEDAEYLPDKLEVFYEDDPAGICSAMETGGEIIEMIGNLPEVLKTVLLLRENEGMTYGQIAKKMGCPVGTVRSRIHRVRTEIRKILQKNM